MNHITEVLASPYIYIYMDVYIDIRNILNIEEITMQREMKANC